MKRLGILILGLLFAAPVLANDIETVLVVSIDALHPDALSVKTSPTLHALMLSGRYTLEGMSVAPPLTLVAHTAMMTGLAPEASGKTDNEWKPGMPRVTWPTLFDDARRRGFRTAFHYAKQKLGYLVNDAVDEHALAPDDGIDRTRAFFRKGGKRFAFLHVSGLEYAGTDHGWLSAEYLDELSTIDQALAPLFADLAKRGRHVIVVTSDHAGHDRQHGTSHPEDFKVPLIVAADRDRLRLPSAGYVVTGLKNMVKNILAAETPGDERPAAPAGKEVRPNRY